jgi:hypothetical protein
MHHHRRAAIFAVAAASAVVIAACGGDNSGSSGATTSAAAGAATTAAGGAGTTGASKLDTNLKGVCPDTIAIQTDWFPEAEHGALYELVGANPTIDANKKIVTGPLTSGGTDTGVKIELRTGGPAIGFQQVSSQMKQDPSIYLGYVSSDEAVENYAQIPTVAVMAPLEINPQIIMWDPATYPNVTSIKDLGTQGVKIRYFQTGAYMTYLVSAGMVKESQLDGSYDGSPAVWVAEGGKIAQQGFASAEPYTYEKELPQWNKPVKFQLIDDTGWRPYTQTLAVLKQDLPAKSACLKKLIPIVQKAVVDYVADPAAANALIVKAVADYKDFWVYTPGLAQFSVEEQKKLGLVGNGPDSTVGNFDDARLTDFISKALPVFAAKNPPAGLKPSDIADNEFIDTSIGLPKS